MKRSIPCALALAGALLVLSGCGGSNSSTATPAPQSTAAPSSDTSSSPTTAPSSSGGGAKSSAPAAAAVITIKDFAYSGPSSVAAGTKITVTNEDSEAHTVTADDSSGGFDVKIDPGASATFSAPSTGGSYAFHCTYHSNMHGTLKVT